MEQPYKTISSSSMNSRPNLASITSSILVYDNLDESLKMGAEERKSRLNSPVKFSSTMNILYCDKGYYEVQVDGRRNMVRQGECLFMKSGGICDILYASEDVKFFSVTLSEEFYFPIFNTNSASVLHKFWLQHPVCAIDPAERTELLSLYRFTKRRLLQEEKTAFVPEIVRGYIQSMLFTIYSQLAKEQKKSIASEKPSRQRDLYNRFIELVEKDYAKERNITYYASKLCITPRYLSKVVFKESGRYASECIDSFVISEAKQLIRAHSWTILQISEMLNFSSQSLFGRYFKKATGLTPKQFQEIA